jgi:transcriptional regulator with XRE-family HTH domain
MDFSFRMLNMPGKPPVSFPSERRLMKALGERLRLARRRRRFAVTTVAARAGISRTTLYKAEKGDSAVTFGTYLRVLAVLGLQQDIERLAADDALGRRLQDLALEPGRRS